MGFGICALCAEFALVLFSPKFFQNSVFSIWGFQVNPWFAEYRSGVGPRSSPYAAQPRISAPPPVLSYDMEYLLRTWLGTVREC